MIEINKSTKYFLIFFNKHTTWWCEAGNVKKWQLEVFLWLACDPFLNMELRYGNLQSGAKTRKSSEVFKETV